MREAPYFMDSSLLSTRLGSPDAPLLLDARTREARATAGDIPTARWLGEDPLAAVERLETGGRRVVVACKAGHERSQIVAASLRARGVPASVLAGGVAAWIAAGHPVIPRDAADRFGGPARLWATRRRPKIDRVACPWLIRRFLDPEARFLFLDPPDLLAGAAAAGAIAFDAPGAEIEHDCERCSFDTLLEKTGLAAWPGLADLALIVRAADTDRLDLAPAAAGYLAVSLGLSQLAGDDDRAMLCHGSVVLDGLYAFLTRARGETHSWTNRNGTT